jgi:hypothetical protein
MTILAFEIGFDHYRLGLPLEISRFQDYLLLEVIKPNNAGSIRTYILAIEKQDVSGDERYLLERSRNWNRELIS